MGNCVKPVDPLIASIPRSSGIDASAVKDSGLPIFFIVGGPGAGKRTQCWKLAEKYGFLTIVCSDILRDEVSTRSRRGVILARLMSEGRLIPPDVLLELLKVKMLDTLNQTKGFVLSGFPREKEQSKLFDKQIRSPDLVIYLRVRNSVMRDRILARTVATTGRQEHRFDEIKTRIKQFRKNSKPIFKYYRDIMVEIDAELDELTVFEDVCNAIDATLQKISAGTS